MNSEYEELKSLQTSLTGLIMNPIKSIMGGGSGEFCHQLVASRRHADGAHCAGA